MRACFHWTCAAALGAGAFLTACSREKTDTILDVNSSEVTFPNGTKILAENMRKELDIEPQAELPVKHAHRDDGR